jgi:hypothetical protein
VSTENRCSCTPLHIKSTPSLGLTVITHFYLMFARAGRICDHRYVVNWFKEMWRKLPKGGGIKRPREDAVQVHLSVADYTKTPTAHTRSTHTQRIFFDSRLRQWQGESSPDPAGPASPEGSPQWVRPAQTCRIRTAFSLPLSQA